MVKCKIPVNKSGKHNEELVLVSHKKKLTIAKYDGDERIEVQLKDIDPIINTLMFLERVQWRIDKECRDKPIKVKIPVNKTEELVIVLQHEGMLNIEKYESDQRIEVREKDLPRIIDSLIFVNEQENKYPK